MSEELPSGFDLYFWGPQANRLAASVDRSRVGLTAGPEGGCLSLPNECDGEWVTALLARMDRARQEGGLAFGVSPGDALGAKEVLIAWESYRRTAHLPVTLTRRAASIDLSHPPGVEAMDAFLSGWPWD